MSEEKKEITTEELQAKVADLTEQVKTLTEERDEARKGLEDTTASLDQARKVNQNLLNRLVSGIDIQPRTEEKPEMSFDDAINNWYNRA